MHPEKSINSEENTNPKKGMHPEEKKDWKILIIPLSYIFFMFIAVFIGLNIIPTDSVGTIGALGIPTITWTWVFIPFIISCIAPVIISSICVRMMPDEDANQ